MVAMLEMLATSSQREAWKLMVIGFFWQSQPNSYHLRVKCLIYGQKHNTVTCSNFAMIPKKYQSGFERDKLGFWNDDSNAPIVRYG